MTITRNNIDMNFNRGISAVQDVERAARELEKAYQEGDAIMADLEDCWEGENADLYRAILRKRVDKLHDRAGVLRRLAEAMYETVQVDRQDQYNAFYEQQRKGKEPQN